MAAPNQWRTARHARPGRTRVPDPHIRVLLFLLLAAALLAGAAFPVGHELGTRFMQEALAR